MGAFTYPIFSSGEHWEEGHVTSLSASLEKLVCYDIVRLMNFRVEEETVVKGYNKKKSSFFFFL